MQSLRPMKKLSKKHKRLRQRIKQLPKRLRLNQMKMLVKRNQTMRKNLKRKKSKRMKMKTKMKMKMMEPALEIIARVMVIDFSAPFSMAQQRLSMTTMWLWFLRLLPPARSPKWHSLLKMMKEPS